MDEQREAQEELAELERDVNDLRREQEAEARFWVPAPPPSLHDAPYDPVGSGYAADDPKRPDAPSWS